MKKTRKLLMLVLAVALCIGMVPMTVLAATAPTPVDKIQVTGVETPVVGEEMSFEWEIPIDAPYQKMASTGGAMAGWARMSHIPDFTDMEQAFDGLGPDDIYMDPTGGVEFEE